MVGRTAGVWAWARRLPVTAAFVAAAVGLHVAVWVYRLWFPEHAGDAFWTLGAVSHLMRVAEPDLNGPFDLWDGQWWRMIVSGFHHANPVHLLMNGAALVFLGELLEPRMRRVGYVLFLLAGLVISLLPEYLLGNTPVGLSGMICAMFGALIVLRRVDDAVAERLTQSMVLLTFSALFVMVPLTWMGVMRIANAAHFSGLAYGWIAGAVWFGEPSQRALRWAFAAAHLLIIPAALFAMQPVWNGRYHWYLATQESEPALRIALLNEAVTREPALPRVWLELAEHHREQGELLRAWETILTGIRHNRSHAESLRLARTLWLQLRSDDERAEGMKTIDRVFGEESLAWQSRLGMGPVLAESGGSGRGTADGMSDEERYSLEQRIVLPPSLDGSDALPVREQQLPPVDPNDPASAAEGVTL